VQGPGPGRNGEPVEHRLRLVGGRVPRGVVASGVAFRQRVADLPGAVLQVAAGPEIGALAVQGHAEPLAQHCDEALVVVGSRPKAVVDVQRRDLRIEAQRDIQQANRVSTPGEHHQQRLACRHQATLVRGLERTLAHVAFRTARQSRPGLSKPLSLTSPMPSKRRCRAPRTASTTASVTSTSPPRARATTREARLTSRPK
jgi:hypothetical protein